MLAYASKLTDTPSFVDRDDMEKLRASGWSDDAIWQITALASFFNFSGRMEAASGLPADVIPDNASFKEAKAD